MHAAAQEKWHVHDWNVGPTFVQHQLQMCKEYTIRVVHLLLNPYSNFVTYCNSAVLKGSIELGRRVTVHCI